MKKYLVLLSLSGLSLIISGCGSTPQVAVPSQPIVVQTPVAVQTPQPEAVKTETVDLTQKSQMFHSGMNDGCATAKGKYSKNSASYNDGSEYKDGWFYGRRKCQPH